MSSDLKPSRWTLESIFVVHLGFCCLNYIEQLFFLGSKYTTIFQILFGFLCHAYLTFKQVQWFYFVHWLCVTLYIFINLTSPWINHYCFLFSFTFPVWCTIDKDLSKTHNTNTKQLILIHCICKTLQFTNLCASSHFAIACYFSVIKAIKV